MRAAQLIQHLTTAVVGLDEHLKVLALNAAAEDLLAISEHRAAGRPFAELVPGPTELHERLRNAVRHQHPFMQRELELVFHGTRTSVVDCAVTPAGGRSGAALALELVPVDRIRRLALEERLLEQESTNRAMFSRLAHEIKNPLGGLRGAAQLLERQLSSADQRQYTEVIIREADRLAKLVERMLGPPRPKRVARINIHEVLEHIRLLLLAEIPTGLEIVRDFDPSLPEFPADRDQVVQALLNLARNAIQALEGRGSIVFRTRIERGMTLRGRRQRVTIRTDVEDHGPGIPPYLVPKLFQPMVSAKSGGAGLGLAIAQHIATGHGGLISAVSRPGRTVFSLFLPLEGSSDDEAARLDR